mmetsp:Transcript_7707/g.19641  ORF Transcript_7707/g.19641 Transcript_7707/m.19641 type:complete len:252 (-) Transcript_7707:41-796(-)
MSRTFWGKASPKSPNADDSPATNFLISGTKKLATSSGVSAKALIMNLASLESEPAIKRSVVTIPGLSMCRTTFSMPRVLNSAFTDFMSCSSPRLVDPYAAMFGVPFPVTPAPSMLNMWPVRSCVRMTAVASFRQYMTPKVFVSTISFRTAESVSTKGLNEYAFVPALFIQMSMFPTRSFANCARSFTCPGLDTSQTFPATFSSPNRVWRSPTTSATVSSDLEHTTTRSPFSRKAVAMARPTPLVLPVTTTP